MSRFWCDECRVFLALERHIREPFCVEKDCPVCKSLPEPQYLLNGSCSECGTKAKEIQG